MAKRAKIKLSRLPLSKEIAAKPVVKEESSKDLVLEFTALLATLSSRGQSLLDSMKSCNPNFYPIKPITKINWEHELESLIDCMTKGYHHIRSTYLLPEEKAA